MVSAEALSYDADTADGGLYGCVVEPAYLAYAVDVVVILPQLRNLNT